jgi:tetratricopeptide (TPR) repeat protein
LSSRADFFVSYASSDRAWAEWIAWQLEDEGYQVVVQAWDFSPGRDWAHEMQQATATAERVIAVLSTAYLQSSHGEAEWRAFYAKDPSGERGLLLPVRVSDVEPPGLLTTRIYVDLVGRDANSARATLLAAAHRSRGKPTEAPVFPGDQQAEASPTEAPRFPGELPGVWNIPFHPNPFFTGRHQLLAELHARLTAADATVRRVALTGLGGVGKTQLAVEFAYQQRADYDLVWWVRGERPTSLLGNYATLADQAPLAADLQLRQGMPQEAVAAAVRAWLEQHSGWLLVLDDVDDPTALAGLLPRGLSGHVLLTSRSETGWEMLANPVPVEVLAPGDAAGFLLARTQQHGPHAEAAAIALADSLGGLPLGLEQAAAYVTAAGTVTLADYAKLFATRAHELLRQGQPLGYQHTVSTTWSVALQRLKDTGPAAVGLLSLAAYLAPDDLPQPVLVAHANQLPEPLAAEAGDPLGLASAVAALRRHSLIRVIGEGLFVHRLLQTVVRAALDTESERLWAAAAIRMLRVEFPNRSSCVSTWAECERLLPHVLAAAEHAQRLDVEPEAWPWLLHKSAVYLSSRGQYRQALPHHKRALTGRRRLLGDEHPDTLESMNDMAETLRELGELQSALKLHEQALAGHRRVLGDNHPRALYSMNNVAETLRELGDAESALKLQEQALAGRRQALGEEHPDTLESIHNLAGVLRQAGRLREAYQLQKPTVDSCKRILGEEHPDTLGSMNNLAQMVRDLGDLEEARRIHERTLAGLRRVLGDDHPFTLHSMNNTAEVLFELGELEHAFRLQEQALIGRRRVLGEHHPRTHESRKNLAAIRDALGRS